MISTLQTNGWTPERRARQAALIARWQPWRRSSGPRTEAGKARSAANARKHGFRSRAYRDRIRNVRNLLRTSARAIALARACLRVSRTLEVPAARQRPTKVTAAERAVQYRGRGGRGIVSGDSPIRMRQGGGRC